MSKLTVEPVGQNSTENWGRYDSPVVDQLLAQFAQTSDIDQQKQIMSKIEAAFVNEAPELPLFPGPDWYEYNTSRFTGFPSADNPYAPGIPYAYAPYNATLIILTTITPK
jgi:peptide/nickel transport system substrate-binding protein